MTSKQSQKELVDELSKCKIDISKLKNTLNELDNEKEKWLKRKRELSSQIRENIKKNIFSTLG